MTIKANQPRLLAAAQQALSGPATDFAEHTEDERGHGRTEERILRTVAVTDEMAIDFPHAAQIFRVIRYVGGLDGQRRTKEVAHCITSLTLDATAGRTSSSSAPGRRVVALREDDGMTHPAIPEACRPARVNS